MFVFGGDLNGWDQDSSKVVDEDVFAEGSVPIVKVSFLVIFIRSGFELLQIKVDEAGGALDELAFTEWIYVL